MFEWRLKWTHYYQGKIEFPPRMLLRLFLMKLDERDNGSEANDFIIWRRSILIYYTIYNITKLRWLKKYPKHIFGNVTVIKINDFKRNRYHR